MNKIECLEEFVWDLINSGKLTRVCFEREYDTLWIEAIKGGLKIKVFSGIGCSSLYVEDDGKYIGSSSSREVNNIYNTLRKVVSQSEKEGISGKVSELREKFGV